MAAIDHQWKEMATIVTRPSSSLFVSPPALTWPPAVLPLLAQLSTAGCSCFVKWKGVLRPGQTAAFRVRAARSLRQLVEDGLAKNALLECLGHPIINGLNDYIINQIIDPFIMVVVQVVTWLMIG